MNDQLVCSGIHDREGQQHLYLSVADCYALRSYCMERMKVIENMFPDLSVAPGHVLDAYAVLEAKHTRMSACLAAVLDKY